MGDVTKIEGQTCAEKHVQALAEAAHHMEDAPQGSGIIIIYADPFAEYELLEQSNMHKSEIIAACYTVAAILAVGDE